MIALGIDPGSNTGIIALHDGRYLAHAVVAKPGRRVKEDHADQELRFVAKMADVLAPWSDARLVVIERPIDGAAFWSGQGQKGQRRGTAFALGVNYLSALVAVQQACPLARIVTYPVIGKAGDRGWFPRLTKRELLLMALRQSLAEIGAPGDLPDHCLCAFGVLDHHERQRGVRAA